MGVCLSCRKSRLSSEKSEQISASATPLHVSVEEQEEPTLGPSLEDQDSGYTRMATTMPNFFKKVCSKRRRRYTKDGFNLDLTYIRDNVIAMGFPAEKLEGVYRNHIDDVRKFLEEKHKDHYKVFNLCSERKYDRKKFHQVADYPFDDHNPPKMEIIKPFCTDVHTWLSMDRRNVAAVHCKAGKGRTGVMICCYLLHGRLFSTAEEALNYYGEMRTHDQKGVTIPSQRRYVGYYATLIERNLNYSPVTLVLKEILIKPLPAFNGGQGCLQFVVSQSKNVFTSQDYNVKKGTTSIRIRIDQYVPLQGDIKVAFFNKPKMMRKEKLFHFWFNTYFVNEEVTPAELGGGDIGDKASGSKVTDSLAMNCGEQSRISNLGKIQTRTSSLMDLDPDLKMVILRLDKSGLDDAHKDKQNKIFSADFKVCVYFHQVQESSSSMAALATDHGHTWHGGVPPDPTHEHFNDTPSGSSGAESSESEGDAGEEGWDSVDSTEPRVGMYRLLPDPDYRHSGQVYQS